MRLLPISMALLPTLACAGESAPFPLRETIARLGADEIEERTGAARALGERLALLEAEGSRPGLREAMDALRRAAKGEDAEVQAAARAILAPYLAGGIRWTLPPDDLPCPALLIPWEGAIAAAGGRMDEAWVARIEPATGKIVRMHSLDRRVQELQATPRGLLATGTHLDDLGWAALLCPSAGKLLWMAEKLPGSIDSIQADAETAIAFGSLPRYARHAKARSSGMTGSLVWVGALSMETGRLLWSRTDDLPHLSIISPRCPEGILAAGSSVNRGKTWIALLDPKNGKTRWEAEADGETATSCLASEGVAIVSGTDHQDSKGWIHAREAATGKPLWEMELPRFLNTVQALPEGRLFLAGMEGEGKAWCATLEARTGKPVWKRSGHRTLYYSVKLLPQGLLACGGSVDGRQGALHLLDPATGGPRWSSDRLRFRVSPPILTPAGISITGNDPKTNALMASLHDLATGKVLREQPLAGSLYCPTPLGMVCADDEGIRLYRLLDADAEPKDR